MSEISEEWLPMKEVAERLHISPYRLSRMAQKGAIKTQTDVLDGRVKLVELSEVKRVFRIKE